MINIMIFSILFRVIYPVKPDCMQGGPRGDSCYIYRKIKLLKLTENGLKRVNSWVTKTNYLGKSNCFC